MSRHAPTLEPQLRANAIKLADRPMPAVAMELLDLLMNADRNAGHTAAAAAGALVQGADLIVHDSRAIKYVRDLAQHLTGEEAARRLSILPVAAATQRRLGNRRPLVLDHHVVYLALRGAEDWFERAKEVAKEALRLERAVESRRAHSQTQRMRIFSLEDRLRKYESETSWIPHFKKHWMEDGRHR